MVQVSFGSAGRSLPNSYIYVCHKHLTVKTFLYLRGVGRLEEELQGFLQVGAGIFHCIPLARNIQLGTEGDVPVSLTVDDSRHLTRASHCGTPFRYLRRLDHHSVRSISAVLSSGLPPASPRGSDGAGRG